MREVLARSGESVSDEMIRYLCKSQCQHRVVAQGQLLTVGAEGEATGAAAAGGLVRAAEGDESAAVLEVLVVATEPRAGPVVVTADTEVVVAS